VVGRRSFAQDRWDLPCHRSHAAQLWSLGHETHEADMKLILLNLFVIFLVGSPLLALEFARSYSRWIDKHDDGLSFAVWFFVLLAVYIWVLPRLGLQPNWNVLSPS